MARTSPTTQAVVRTGLTPSYTAPDATGDIVAPGTFLHVKNDGGSQITVTVKTTVTYDGLSVSDQTVTVAAAGEKFIGPLIGRAFAQPADAAEGPSQVLVNYSGVTSVTRAVLSV